jgi:hypothetical protein
MIKKIGLNGSNAYITFTRQETRNLSLDKGKFLWVTLEEVK